MTFHPCAPFHPSAFNPHFIQVKCFSSALHPHFIDAKCFSLCFHGNLSPLVHLAFQMFPWWSFIQVLFIQVSAISATFIQVPPSIKHPRWSWHFIPIWSIMVIFRHWSILPGQSAFHRAFVVIFRHWSIFTCFPGDLSSKFFSSKSRPLHLLLGCPFIQMLFIQVLPTLSTTAFMPLHTLVECHFIHSPSAPSSKWSFIQVLFVHFMPLHPQLLLCHFIYSPGHCFSCFMPLHPLPKCPFIHPSKVSALSAHFIHLLFIQVLCFGICFSSTFIFRHLLFIQVLCSGIFFLPASFIQLPPSKFHPLRQLHLLATPTSFHPSFGRFIHFPGAPSSGASIHLIFSQVLFHPSTCVSVKFCVVFRHPVLCCCFFSSRWCAAASSCFSCKFCVAFIQVVCLCIHLHFSQVLFHHMRFSCFSSRWCAAASTVFWAAFHPGGSPVRPLHLNQVLFHPHAFQLLFIQVVVPCVPCVLWCVWSRWWSRASPAFCGAFDPGGGPVRPLHFSQDRA